MPKIAVLGDTFIDIQTGPLKQMPTWNCDLRAETVKLMLGGSAANTARLLGLFGSKTRLFSSLGDDDVSTMQVQKLRSEKLVETENSLLQIKNTSAPTAIVLFGENNRGFISNRGSLESYSVLDINKKILFGYEHLHFGGYFVCIGMQTNKLINLIKETKEKGITISMDCQYDSTQTWKGKDGNLLKILPLLDVFMPSEYEAQGITNKTTLLEALSELRNLMPNSLVIIKNGEKGILFSLPKKYQIEGAEKVFKVSAETVDVVDSTGAGDAFNAGFLHKWVKGLTKIVDEKGDKKDAYLKLVMDSAKYGCWAGTKCVQAKGAFVKEIYQ